MKASIGQQSNIPAAGGAQAVKRGDVFWADGVAIRIGQLIAVKAVAEATR